MKPVYGPRSPQTQTQTPMPTRTPGSVGAGRRIGPPPPDPDPTEQLDQRVDRASLPTTRRIAARYRAVALGGGLVVLAVSVTGLWMVAGLAFG